MNRVAGGKKEVHVEMKAEVHKGIAGLNSLRKQWEKLHCFCDLWARFEWYHSYVTNLAVDAENIYYIQVIAGGETVAIIPAEICAQKNGLIKSPKVLCLAFHSHISLTDFPLNPHIDPHKVAACMLQAFQKLPVKWNLIRWSRIMHSSHALTVARTITNCTVLMRPGKLCNIVDTSKPFAEYFNTLSNHTRSQLRRMRKRLTEVGSWHIVQNIDFEDIDTSYKEFLRIESSGWKGKAGSAIELNRGARGFYATLLEQSSLDFIPEITLLMLESKSIAGEFSITTHACRYSLKVGYDEQYSKVTPGQLLTEEVVKYACGSTSIEQMNFITDMQHQLLWHPRREETFDVIIFRRRLYGFLFNCYYLAGRLAKSAKQLILPENKMKKS